MEKKILSSRICFSRKPREALYFFASHILHLVYLILYALGI